MHILVVNNIYPPIYPQLLVREKGGRHFLAIVVFASENRPHFTGKSYIRKGTETVVASEQQFEELIAKRGSKAAQILKRIKRGRPRPEEKPIS